MDELNKLIDRANSYAEIGNVSCAGILVNSAEVMARNIGRDISEETKRVMEMALTIGIPVSAADGDEFLRIGNVGTAVNFYCATERYREKLGMDYDKQVEKEREFARVG